MSKASEVSIGSVHRLMYGENMGQPYPNLLVEVVGKPFSGDYSAKQNGQIVRVKIGQCVRVRFLGEHTCPRECTRDHEIAARFDQLTPETEHN